MHILFSTYRTFTDTQTLIDRLINRYRSVLPASLDMTEDVRQKTLKYENFFILKNTHLDLFSVRFKSSMSISIYAIFIHLMLHFLLEKFIF